MGNRTPVAVRTLSRRKALSLGGSMTATAFAAAGCGLFATDPDTPDTKSGARKKGREAPILADLVSDGDLPAVAERLPVNPLVIEPVDEIGRYGGTWRSYLDGLAAVGYKFYVELGYDSLIRWTPDWTGIVPNLAESWEIEDDGHAFIFHLREGVKWSDGEPFTADDVLFVFEDVWGNEELTPVPPRTFVADEKLATCEKVDDYTVRIAFTSPKAQFLRLLATPDSYYSGILRPAHYLRDFLPAQNENADQLAADAGFNDWIEYFGDRNDATTNTELPTLNAWMLVQSIDDSSGRAIFERNPYYWKTDPDGSQLPYVDRVTYEVTDLEVALIRTTNGELDLNSPPLTAGVTALSNKPVLAASREDGGYDFVDGVPTSENQVVIAFNLTHEDPVMREIFQNHDFRVGLSYAMNREEILDAVFQRQGEPWQVAPRRESHFYHEELATQYLEYDVDLANEHLDRAGYTERDGEGFRLGPNGGRIRFSVDLVTNEPTQISTMELVREYWAGVGVDMRPNTIDRTLFYDRKAANQHDANVWTGVGAYIDADLDPRWYFPYSGESNYAMPWAEWYNSRGESGEEPPAAAVEQMELYDEFTVTMDEDKQQELYMRLLDIAREQFWVMGVVLDDSAYGTVRNAFRNVPAEIPASWLYPTPGPARPEQFYVDEE